MRSKDHQISKLVMKIHLPSQERAHEWMNTTASVTKSSVLKSINKVLDEFDTEGKIIRIPKIEIDLTESGLESINEETALLIEEKLRTELARLIHHNDLQQVLTERGIATSEEGVEIIDQVVSDEEQVFFFLEHGYLPWWAKNTPALLNQVMEHLLEEVSGEKKYKAPTPQVGENSPEIKAGAILQKTWVKKMRALLEKEPARKRIAMQLQLPHLEKLVRLLPNESLPEELVRVLLESSTEKRPVYARVLQYLAQPIDLVQWMAKVIDDAPVQIRLKKMLANSQANEKIFKSIVEGILESGLDKTEIQNLLQPFEKKYKWVEEMVGEELKRPQKQEKKQAEPSRGEKFYQPEIKEAIDLYQAGLVIVHPYLVPFFTALELLEGNQFKNEDARHYAVHVLHYLASGKTELPEEHQLVLHKLLCGLEPGEVLQTDFQVSEAHQQQCEELLESVIEHWPALKKTSPASLRHTFFERNGRLFSEKNGWSLKIERNTVDILLDKLPWGLGVIKTPWYNEFIFVEW